MSNYTIDIIEKVRNDDFNIVWEGCKEDAMSESVFSWSEFNATTEEEKRETALTLYRSFASDSERTVVRVRAGARCLALVAGTIQGTNFEWSMWLAGSDAQNSKAWMYTDELQTVRALIRQTMGTTTATFNMLKGDTVAWRNVQSLINANKFSLAEENTKSDNVVNRKVTFGE